MVAMWAATRVECISPMALAGYCDEQITCVVSNVSLVCQSAVRVVYLVSVLSVVAYSNVGCSKL